MPNDPISRVADSPKSRVKAVGGFGGVPEDAVQPFRVALRLFSVPVVALVTDTSRYIACGPAPPAQLLLSTAANGVTAVMVTFPALSASTHAGQTQARNAAATNPAASTPACAGRGKTRCPPFPRFGITASPEMRLEGRARRKRGATLNFAGRRWELRFAPRPAIDFRTVATKFVSASRV